MVDDIMDDVHSFVKAAQVLKDNGACKVYCMATHGILSKEAPILIQQSCIDEVVVTNSVPHDAQKAKSDKIKSVDISILLAEAIRRIHNKESMSHLFRNVTMAVNMKLLNGILLSKFIDLDYKQYGILLLSLI